MKDKKQTKKTYIGGQAVMEGVMMRGPKEIATAVRKSDGEIIVDKSILFMVYVFIGLLIFICI